MNIRRLVDRTLGLYVTIGVLNFIVCTALMFVLFNMCGFSEHLAPVFNYGLGSLIWYLSSRYILFPDHPTTLQRVFYFIIEVLVCYLLSYYIAAPYLSGLLLESDAVQRFFSFGGADKIAGNCEMTVGAVFYAVINYFGQRYFVFSDRFEHHKKQRESVR